MMALVKAFVIYVLFSFAAYRLIPICAAQLDFERTLRHAILVLVTGIAFLLHDSLSTSIQSFITQFFIVHAILYVAISYKWPKDNIYLYLRHHHVDLGSRLVMSCASTPFIYILGALAKEIPNILQYVLGTSNRFIILVFGSPLHQIAIDMHYGTRASFVASLLIFVPIIVIGLKSKLVGAFLNMVMQATRTAYSGSLQAFRASKRVSTTAVVSIVNATTQVSGDFFRASKVVTADTLDSSKEKSPKPGNSFFTTLLEVLYIVERWVLIKCVSNVLLLCLPIIKNNKEVFIVLGFTFGSISLFVVMWRNRKFSVRRMIGNCKLQLTQGYQKVVKSLWKVEAGKKYQRLRAKLQIKHRLVRALHRFRLFLPRSLPKYSATSLIDVSADSSIAKEAVQSLASATESSSSRNESNDEGVRSASDQHGSKQPATEYSQCRRTYSVAVHCAAAKATDFIASRDLQKHHYAQAIAVSDSYHPSESSDVDEQNSSGQDDVAQAGLKREYSIAVHCVAAVAPNFIAHSGFKAKSYYEAQIAELESKVQAIEEGASSVIIGPCAKHGSEMDDNLRMKPEHIFSLGRGLEVARLNLERSDKVVEGAVYAWANEACRTGSIRERQLQKSTGARPIFEKLYEGDLDLDSFLGLGSHTGLASSTSQTSPLLLPSLSSAIFHAKQDAVMAALDVRDREIEIDEDIGDMPQSPTLYARRKLLETRAAKKDPVRANSMEMRRDLIREGTKALIQGRYLF